MLKSRGHLTTLICHRSVAISPRAPCSSFPSDSTLQMQIFRAANRFGSSSFPQGSCWAHVPEPAYFLHAWHHLCTEVTVRFFTGSSSSSFEIWMKNTCFSPQTARMLP